MILFRRALQEALFPATFYSRKPSAKLHPGDVRLHMALKILVEVKKEIKLRLPTREPSKVNNYCDTVLRQLTNIAPHRIGVTIPLEISGRLRSVVDPSAGWMFISVPIQGLRMTCRCWRPRMVMIACFNYILIPSKCSRV